MGERECVCVCSRKAGKRERDTQHRQERGRVREITRGKAERECKREARKREINKRCKTEGDIHIHAIQRRERDNMAGNKER